MKISSRSLVAGMTLSVATLMMACTQVTPNFHSTTATMADAATTASPASIQLSAKAVGERAMAWQLAHMDNFDYVKKFNKNTADTKNWVQGAFYIGLTRWTEATDSKAGLEAISSISKSNEFELGRRPFHGDDHAIGQTYLWLFEKSGDKAAYGPTQEIFDGILADQPTTSLEFLEKTDPRYTGTCQKRWCWSDALFMTPRTWLKLSNATGDSRYWEYADKEFWATTDYLFSQEHNLYFRDSRYFDRKSGNGAPVFWSRGNGWVFAGLPLIIDDLPDDHPSKPRYIEFYKTMAKRLVEIQKPDGYWAPSLMDANAVTTPETSGTGFITFGLAWGVNNGTLTDEATINATKKGWAALEAAVGEDGMVHWVQQIGKSPDPVDVNDTQLYGAGAVLLAASEMLKWEK